MSLTASISEGERSRRSWFLAENLGFGHGGGASAAAIVRSWMRSAEHRTTVLEPKARDAGVGVAIGSPTGGGGATYTLDFGRVS